MRSGYVRKVSRWVLLLAFGPGCAWSVGSVGEATTPQVAALAPGSRVELTTVEVTTPNRPKDVTVTGEVQWFSGDTLYLADGEVVPRAAIVAVRQLSKGTTFLHDVAMGALAGLAMHVAINGLSLGMH